MEEKLAPVEETKAEAPKKRSRKPISKEHKQAMAKARADAAEKAAHLKPSVYVKYQGSEIEVGTLLEAAKEDFHSEKKRTRITDLKLYIKPEEQTAYYVINEKFEGKVFYLDGNVSCPE